jgi:murein DD-endopeptidase MepM/ murein hydrolase activator NlpD
MISKLKSRVFIGTLLIFTFVGTGCFMVNRMAKREVIATDDFTDFEVLILESGVDTGVEILDDEFQTFEKDYVLKEEKEKEEETRVDYYVVQPGDSLYKISNKIGIDMNVLIANNASVKDGRIRVGQKLKILNGNNIEYKVQSGDSLIKIANKFNVKLDELIENNGLSSTQLQVGQNIIVKNPDLNYVNKEVERLKGFQIKNWPVAWTGVTSPFGQRYHPVLKRNIFHKGVDLRARYVSLYAPADGVISTAGWMSGYGQIIIIKHKDGYETRHAHLNKMYVKSGEKVRAGQLIGETGQTGRVTGPHLHFEVRKNGKPLDPMKFKK